MCTQTARGCRGLLQKKCSGRIILHQLDISDVVLALCKNFCLEYIFPRFTDSKTPVLVPDLDEGDLLVLLIRIEVDVGDLGRKEAVPEELAGIGGVLHDLDTLPHHLRCLLDARSTLSDGKSHIAGIDHEDDPLIAVINDAIATACAGKALELGDEAHALLSQRDLWHVYTLAAFKISDSPGSTTASALTTYGLPQAFPSWTLEPS